MRELLYKPRIKISKVVLKTNYQHALNNPVFRGFPFFLILLAKLTLKKKMHQILEENLLYSKFSYVFSQNQTFIIQTHFMSTNYQSKNKNT